MWHPYRYLIAGRTKWEVIWIDPSVVSDARAHFEEKLAPKLGRLVGFEPVPELQPKTGREIVTLAEDLERQIGQLRA
jgi:hypothetical protein